MNAMLAKQPESIAELNVVSSVKNFFVSWQTSDPVVGAFQDMVIGLFEMTRSSVNNIHKYHAMRMCMRATTYKPPRFTKRSYTSRELLSMFLPPINFEGKPKFVVADHEPWIKYRDDERRVVIRRGELVQGVLDNGTVGKSASGGIFHTIFNEYGATAALDAVYNWQQVVNNFIYYGGITFGLADIHLSARARERLGAEIGKLVAASEDITQQLDAGKLVPPIEMTLSEYYEELQSAALERGDEFLRPIMDDIDPDTNWFYKFVHSGSKGDIGNMLAIYAAIGSIELKGGRIPMAMDHRTTINFPRFDTSPASRGFCADSFSRGVSAGVFPFAAMEARHEIITVALSTAIAGTMNRNAVKNLENICIDNTLASAKGARLVQLLFGETGVDPRRMRAVTFPGVRDATVAHRAAHWAAPATLATQWRNAAVAARMETEYTEIRAAVREFRDIMMGRERAVRRNFLMKERTRMPIDPALELRNAREALGTTYRAAPLDPVACADTVRTWSTRLAYVFSSRAGWHLECACTLLRVLVRVTLTVRAITEAGIDNTMLTQVLDTLALKMGESLIEPGTNVGVIASQSVSEPIMQFLLDAKHRSGMKKEKTNGLVHFEEIVKNTPTERMDNPQMVLIPRAAYQQDRARVREIATRLEMLTLGAFVQSTRVFAEQWGQPTHPAYRDEREWLQRFEALTLGERVPHDIVGWCIRFELNAEEMVLKSIRMPEIWLTLRERFPHVFIAFSSREPVMRVYPRATAFRKSAPTADIVMSIAHEMHGTCVRGVRGITATNVVAMPHTVELSDGTCELARMWVIETDGTNLSEVIDSPYLIAYECNSTSVDEIERMYGVEAARNKIVDEIYTTENQKVNYEWATIYADEMCYTGRVTSLQRSGLGQREQNDVLLRASFGSPVQVLQQAAINNTTDTIHGMSAPLILGTVPRFGTTYNDIAIDHEAVARLTVSDAALIEAL